MRKNSEELSIIIALLVSIIYDHEDPGFAEHFLYRMRDRLKRTESWDPEMDEVFEFRREFPKFKHPLEYKYPLYRKVRRYLRETQFWDPELDDMLEYALRSPPRYREDRELVSVTRGLMREFTDHVERNIEKSNSELKNQISEIGDRSGNVEKKIDSMKSSHTELAKEVKEHGVEITLSKGELHNFLWLSSVGADFKNSKAQRYVPVKVYIADPVPSRNNLNDITERLNAFASLLGFDLTDDLPEEKGSWWKKIFYKTKEFLTHDEVLERVESAEAALKLKHLDKPQAEANKAQAEAASQLITALKDTSAACVQVGSLLLVKAPNSNGDSAIFTRTLTAKELKELEENQSILGQPERVLEWLQGCNSSKKLPSPQ